MSEITIPLNKMVPWSGNVRKTGAADGITELAASIAAHGLLQSLVVRKAPRGKYAVIAGGRRYRAMTQLVGSGTLDADYGVPCRLLDGDCDPTEISLAENVVRAPMHPADQFEAYRQLIDNGASARTVRRTGWWPARGTLRQRGEASRRPRARGRSRVVGTRRLHRTSPPRMGARSRPCPLPSAALGRLAILKSSTRRNEALARDDLVALSDARRCQALVSS